MVECLFERLYLAKDREDCKKDIYVEKCPLIQHQLDGIRFLYKAFKKERPGVILNDPSGYGKRVQIALFLSAILPTLNKPVLILCKEGSDQTWLEHFQKWTKVSNDVIKEVTNPFTKKKVLVSPCYNAGAFACRDWSILVVDNCLSKDLLKATLRPGLRVWITSSNVKEDLYLYSLFHTWLHPKDKFCADKFKARANDLRDVVLKKAMIDAYLEETVLRRNNLDLPFCSTQVPAQVEAPIVTKKNKDATGTKIKRTKRKSVNTDNTVIENIPRKVARTKTINTKNDYLEISRSMAFSETEEHSEVFKTGVIDSNNDNNSQIKFKRNNKFKIIWNSDSEDDSVIKENNRVDSNKSESQLRLRYESGSDSDGNKDSTINTSNEIHNTQTKANNIKGAEIIDENVDKVVDEENKSILICDEIPSVELNDESKVEITGNVKNNELFYKFDELKEDTRSILEDNEKLNVEMGSSKDESDHKITHEVKDDIKMSENLFSTDVSYEKVDEIKEKTQELKINRTKNDKSEKTETDNPGIKVDKPGNALSSFDLKLKQLEELTLKKFKGSFLDSIF